MICDLDGCIFDNGHRAHLIPTDRTYTPNWNAFNQACENDSPIMPVINLVKHLASLQPGDNFRRIIFVTSRGVDAKQQTKDQLFTHFHDFRCELHMRPMDEYRDTVDFKRDVFHKIIEQNNFEKGATIIDDHKGIIDMVSISFPQFNRLLVPSFDCTNADYVAYKFKAA